MNSASSLFATAPAAVAGGGGRPMSAMSQPVNNNNSYLNGNPAGMVPTPFTQTAALPNGHLASSNTQQQQYYWQYQQQQQQQ